MIIHSNPSLPYFEGEVFPWIGGDLQTLRHYLARDVADPPKGDAMTVTLEDGDVLMAAFHAPAGDVRGGIIAVHGLTGCMDSDHIKVLTRDALSRGFAVLRVNMRGAGPARHLAKKSYNAKAGGDLLPFIGMMREALKDKTGDDKTRPVIMVAHSIGGAAALNMILDYPDRLEGLDGLVSIAAPIDMKASNRRFHHPRNFIYMRHLLNGLKRLADNVPDLDPAMLEKIKAVPSIKAFDDLYTGPMMGYEDAMAYYAAATTAHRLTQPVIPTLLIHGDNDPWIPADAYRALTPSATLDIALSRGGGHVGFHDRRGHDQKGVWSNRAVFAWCDQMFGTAP